MAPKRKFPKEEEEELDWDHWDIKEYASSEGITIDMVVEATLNMRKRALKDLKELRNQLDEANNRFYHATQQIEKANDRLYESQKELLTALRGPSGQGNQSETEE